MKREGIIIALHKFFPTYLYFYIHKICNVCLAQNPFFKYHSFFSLRHCIYLVEMHNSSRLVRLAVGFSKPRTFGRVCRERTKFKYQDFKGQKR